MYSKILSGLMVVIFPVALVAAEPAPTAMLYARGETTLNGSRVPRSSALFSGDLVQTSVESVANINKTGSTVLILNDSLVQYEGNGVKLEHGGVTISTSKSMAVHVGGISVSPSASVLTEFELRDVDGSVRIMAHRGDLAVTDGSGTMRLAQGQETTRDESQPQKDNAKKDQKNGPVATAATSPILNDPIVIGVGGAVILGGVAWVLVQGDDPVSPVK